MKIVFLCPPAGVINGGTKYIYQMASVLAESGADVAMFEQDGKRPDWFDTNLPVVGRGVLVPDPGQVFVVPEDQRPLLQDIRDWPQRKVVYSQNQFYGAKSLLPGETYSDFGITHILCSSQTIFDHARRRHSDIKAYVVPCGIDGDLFKPLPKRKIITYMPRKRPVEALYLRDMFFHENPDYRGWEWVEIRGKDVTTTAHMMGEASVFLSLSRLEGFGVTPLEAMAAGCVVAGFTGLGGREYADDENGFWAGEDDFPSCLSGLRDAVRLADEDATSQRRVAYDKACQKILARYTGDAFRRAVLQSWTQILR